jgi:hypothetical protein
MTISTAIPHLGLVVLVLVSMSMPAQSRSAPSAELARKCREMAVQVHPTAVAGSAQGTAHAQRKFFRKCIDAGGNVQP